MRALLRNLLWLAVLSLGLGCGAAHAQGAAAGKSQAAPPAGADYIAASTIEDWTGPLGIAAKKPVFAGACKLCPWGQTAIVLKQALSYYGYDLHICWSCATSIGPRDMADKTMLQQNGAEKNTAPLPALPTPGSEPSNRIIERTPPAIPDVSSTSDISLIAAWNGTGAYAADNKKRQNYRLIATVQTPNYLIVAVAKKSGITDLSQLKTRRGTWVFAAENDPVLAYYGITEAMLKANGGGMVPANASRELRAGADVWIGGGLLTDTLEQRMWYEISQINDLNYLTLPDDLLDKLAQQPGYARATMPIALLRGQDQPIKTVNRENHYFYVRDDAPNDFAYLLAKALDEHHDLFRYLNQPWYYDPRLVAATSVIPLHPGALKYYRERGYVK